MDAEEAVERDDPEDPGVRGGKPGFEPTLSHPELILLISHSSFWRNTHQSPHSPGKTISPTCGKSGGVKKKRQVKPGKRLESA